MTTVVVIAIVVLFFIWRMKPAKGVMTVSTEELKKVLKDSKKQFIDVRTVGEYKANHIKQFKNIPLPELARSIDKLDKSKETFVICQSGMRSSKGASILKKAGFEHVINVSGGMGAWKN